MPESAEVQSNYRFTLTALIFVFCCLLSSGRLLWNANKEGDPNRVAARSDQRFAALKAALPEHGVVGYIGNPGQSPGEYYLAQYALAPLVVDYSPDHPLVVGNFSKTSTSIPSNLELVHDFGNGVQLLANEGAR